MSAIVRLQNVSRSFGTKVAVSSLDLEVKAGSIHGFLGPNGSGKTTTLRMITGLMQPDSGTVEVFGKEGGAGASPAMGYLPDDRGLYRGMTVIGILEFFARLKGMHNPRRAVLDWLDRLDLAGAGPLRVEALSKGMAQRVQFIAAIIHSPKLAVLDEPFSGLDPVHAGQLMRAVRELRDAGTTIILSTHDLTVAQRLCTHLFMIHHGRKVLDGSLEDTLARHGCTTVRVTPRDIASPWPGCTGVANATRDGTDWELRLEPDADANSVVRELMRQFPLTAFTTGSASLSDIFFRLVGVREGESVGQGT